MYLKNICLLLRIEFNILCDIKLATPKVKDNNYCLEESSSENSLLIKCVYKQIIDYTIMFYLPFSNRKRPT